MHLDIGDADGLVGIIGVIVCDVFGKARIDVVGRPFVADILCGNLCKDGRITAVLGSHIGDVSQLVKHLGAGHRLFCAEMERIASRL